MEGYLSSLWGNFFPTWQSVFIWRCRPSVANSWLNSFSPTLSIKVLSTRCEVNRHWWTMSSWTLTWFKCIKDFFKSNMQVYKTQYELISIKHGVLSTRSGVIIWLWRQDRLSWPPSAQRLSALASRSSWRCSGSWGRGAGSPAWATCRNSFGWRSGPAQFCNMKKGT